MLRQIEYSRVVGGAWQLAVKPLLCATSSALFEKILQNKNFTQIRSSVTTTTQKQQTYGIPQISTVDVTVNGKQVAVPQGTSILEACRLLHIHVPTLCAHPRLPTTPGTCRLCLVDIGGSLKPACATPVWNGLEVSTDNEKVVSNIKGVLKMLRANHPNDCMTCEANGRCEFQDLLMRYNIGEGYPKLRDFSHEWDQQMSDDAQHWKDHSSKAIELDLDKCLKCGRCVTACNLIQNMNVLGFLNRGRERHPGTPDSADLDMTKCIECGQCTAVCPVNAIHERVEWKDVMELLESKRKVMVVQTAPAVRVAIGEELGYGPGHISTGQMVAACRELGFDHVFDTNFAADLTIMEEGTELLNRLNKAWGNGGDHDQHTGPLPMFTSCCPAWITAVEKSYPELIPHVSSCKSPQMMFAAVLKNYWAAKMGVKKEDVCMVSIMPCTAKKHEGDREEFQDEDKSRHIDYVLTTRELGHMLRHKKIPMASLENQEFDDPLGQSTGAAAMFGATGGVMEAAVRTVYEIVTGKSMPKLELEEVRGLQGIKECTISLKHPEGSGIDKELRLAVAGGIGNARHLLQRMESGEVQYDFIEVMACPGGCIGGGGQPKTKDPLALLKRMQAIYDVDQASTIRKSHENPDIQKLYDNYLGKPNSHLSHELLHTEYSDKSHVTVPAYTVFEKTNGIKQRQQEKIAQTVGKK